MITYTPRLDRALRRAAWAHEQAGQHRKGSDIPYIIHPVGVMTIAGSVTEDEDVLIACLMHDVLEDVDATIYDESTMRKEFGDRVANIVLDVTKNDDQQDWHIRSHEYLEHLQEQACSEALIVSGADKIHNLLSILADYETLGDTLWQRFSTKSAADQLWWYESVLRVLRKRQAPEPLCEQLATQTEQLRHLLNEDYTGTNTGF